MSKITTSAEEANKLESLFPGEDAVYGQAYLPRNFESPMFELLQWQDTEHRSDFKKPSGLFKDRLAKSSTDHAQLMGRKPVGERGPRQLPTVRL